MPKTEKFDIIDRKIQIPLMILTTTGYTIVFFGFWQGAILTLLSQPLWLFTSLQNKQIGIVIVTVVLTIGSIVCIVRGLLGL